MKVVYLASPYSADNDWQKYQNIQNAHLVAKWIWANGIVCISPVSNSAWMEGDIDEQVFIDGDIEILKRCDAVFLSNNWENSNGCNGECDYAKKNNIPIFTTLNELVRWANGKESGDV